MPIYEYVCHACGFAKEHLQKMSDAPIANCPACDSKEYIKKVSAAGFRLKGSGWYVTDFKDKKTTKPDSSTRNEKKAETAQTDTKAETSSTESTPAATANTATAAES
ncbi:FmdB family zinc ribbon protein [Nitrosomonas mobilis]|uniref:Type I antifreeze protein n=1 Tax=Nitrosomonas mobilis TaxID=51642 RepID=A0A1G5SH59_9PROT|nr:zinc ribbon domain-containing protein [Nitrosomonas mobilis]SCZ86337.1 Type I antifreeze protein [Nitrosomonas mobilis]